ncbi:MAG: hypothetical protein NTZ52_00695 [Chlamydiae bacterium]|jgi:hypothetical protein|nr:hypothetical protein [Chlamydiota bacterium]
MLFCLLIPFAIQGLMIIFDEWVYHLKRELPRWERIGHPIDTASFIVCLCFVQLVKFSPSALLWYILLAVISCLLITKDEFIHKHHCEASEHWVHAILFINHPLLLISIGLLWHAVSSTPSPWFLSEAANNKGLITVFVQGQTLFTILFMLYQILYWNFIWKQKENR